MNGFMFFKSKLKMISMHQTMVPNSRKVTYHLKV